MNKPAGIRGVRELTLVIEQEEIDGIRRFRGKITKLLNQHSQQIGLTRTRGTSHQNLCIRYRTSVDIQFCFHILCILAYQQLQSRNTTSAMSPVACSKEESIQILIFRKISDTPIDFLRHDATHDTGILPIHLTISISQLQQSRKKRLLIVLGKETRHDTLRRFR